MRIAGSTIVAATTAVCGGAVALAVLLWSDYGGRNAHRDDIPDVPAPMAQRPSPKADRNKSVVTDPNPDPTLLPDPPNPADNADFDRLRDLFAGPSRNRRTLAREIGQLAQSSDPRAFDILAGALKHASPGVRAMAAVALARSHFEGVSALIQPLLNDPSTTVVRAAVRGLSLSNPEALRQWGLPALEEGELPADVTAELLVALAALGDETAIGLALAAAVDDPDGKLVEELLDHVTLLPDDLSTPLAQAVISAAGTSTERLSQAFTALSDIDTPEAASLLLELAGSRQTTAEREAAAMALSTMADARLPARRLAAAVISEPAAEVRRQLYDAMLSIEDPDPAVLLPAIRRENDPEARLVALFAAGTLVGMGQADRSMETFFRSEAIPELESGAVNQDLSTETRLRAISALRNSRIEDARTALQRLAQSPDPLVRTAAGRPLPGAKPR